MAAVLSSLRAADEVLSGAFDHAFAPAHNPWRHLGALAFLCLMTCVASGIVAYALYDTSVAGAYASGLRLQNDPLLLGRLLRGVHRYGADAFMLLTLAHLLREGVRGHFRGVRWYSWLTGIPLLFLLWLAGITGLWLLWDERALFSVTAMAEWLQALPLGAELLARNFLTPEALGDRFFSLIMFVHIGLPLLLLAATWIHVQRVSLPRMWPPRSLTIATLGTLALLALMQPATSLGPADTGHVAAQLSLDWFYLLVHPLVNALSAQAVWWLVAALTLVLAVLPLWRVPRSLKRASARVDLANCNGCGRCVVDCPFGAVVMVPRTDQSRHPSNLSDSEHTPVAPMGTVRHAARQASVNADLCAACGICVGSCPSATPFRRIEDMVSGIEMPDAPMAALRRELRQKIASLSGPHPVVLFSCRQAADCTQMANATTAVMALECAAMLPPSFIEYALRLGAEGVAVAGCREGDCEFRLGDRWLQQRLAGLREPQLRASVNREQIEVQWAGSDMLGVQAALARLRLRLTSQATWSPPAPLKESEHD